MDNKETLVLSESEIKTMIDDKFSPSPSHKWANRTPTHKKIKKNRAKNKIAKKMRIKQRRNK